MLNRIRRHKISIKHAYDGLVYNYKTQPNFQFHLVAALLVIIFGFYFSISWIEWLVLIFTINLVLIAEMVNTTIESIVDLITLERREDAQIAKDTSAGMVLISAIFAIAIGLFIFLPKILHTL